MQDGISAAQIWQALAAFATSLFYSLLRFMLFTFPGKRGKRLRFQSLWVPWFLLGLFSWLLLLPLALTSSLLPENSAIQIQMLNICGSSSSLKVIVLIEWLHIYWLQTYWLYLRLVTTIGVFVLLLMLSLGVWQLTQRGPEFVWAAPASLHIMIIMVSGRLYVGREISQEPFGTSQKPFGTRKKSFRNWFGLWMATNFAAVVVPVVAACLQVGWLHLAQCSLGMVSVWVYLWRRLLRANNAESADRSTPMDSRTSPTSVLTDITRNDSTFCDNTFEMGTKLGDEGAISPRCVHVSTASRVWWDGNGYGHGG
ncbi:hypothetical protein QBC47DRAFT_385665 [Echria macrotheca]|uniref:Uncharacterized protein n=1 Tax=Echria macrotheca TaxID=438768 RepID=A0AAJ0BC87_9PEZI|nr:hypothetical protein QBC47DRAFT_385665 [Echria macrotheca]